jgi:hypothetical protein
MNRNVINEIRPFDGPFRASNITLLTSALSL